MKKIILATSNIHELWDYILPDISNISDTPDKEIKRYLCEYHLSEISSSIQKALNNEVEFLWDEEYELYTQFSWIDDFLSEDDFKTIIESFKLEVFNLCDRFNIDLSMYRLKLQSVYSYVLIHKNYEHLYYYSDLRK